MPGTWSSSSLSNAGEMASAQRFQVSFEDVSVHFSEEEWVLLDPDQQALHWEVMEENYKMVASLAWPRRDRTADDQSVPSKKALPILLNDEKVEKEIIEFYRSNPHLWNPSHVDYYKKNKRDSTLTVLRDLLASEHGINITSNKILSKKFKNMKDAYKRELSRLQKSKLSGVGTNNVHKIRFPYFKEMDFLRDSMQADESEDTVNLSISLENDKCSQPIVTEEREDLMCTEASEFQELPLTIIQSTEPNTPSCSHDTMNSVSNSVTPTNSQWSSPHPRDDGVTVDRQENKRKRQKTSLVSSPSLRSELYKKAVDYLANKQSNTPTCVEQNFGNHVALSLMNISEDLREEAKYEIQGILLTYYKRSRTNKQ